MLAGLGMFFPELVNIILFPRMPQQGLHNPAFRWLSRTGRISPSGRISPHRQEADGGGLVLVASIPTLAKGGFESRRAEKLSCGFCFEKNLCCLRYSRIHMYRSIIEGTEGTEGFGGGY